MSYDDTVNRFKEAITSPGLIKIVVNLGDKGMFRGYFVSNSATPSQVSIVITALEILKQQLILEFRKRGDFKVV